MNKKFLQSVVVGIMGLSLATSCSFAKKEANFCGAENGCAAKKDEAHKCSAKKGEANKCSANKCSAKKEVKKSEANKCSANKCSAKKSETKKK
jgi:uncharacterized low-complexity protein